MSYMTESEALQELHSSLEAEEWCAERDAEERAVTLRQKIAKMARLRNTALAANVGERVLCPVCGKGVVKKTHNQVFCSNGRTRKGASSCKDKYWNLVDDNRRCRALLQP
jgi:hypothetical protein